MKYSENSSYMEYISCKADGDIEGAKHALLRCLDDPVLVANSVQRSDLLQRIGGLCFEQGDTEKAIDYYDKSEACDPSSLLTSFYYAKFLAEKIKEYGRAVEKCDAILAKASASPFDESDDDFGSADYIRMATDLKNVCNATRR